MHSSHPGINKSLQLAHSLFYWPAMNNDIKNSVTSCAECVKKIHSQPSNPCVTQPPSSLFGPPMAKVSVDLFNHAGKSHLVCIDRWSSFSLYKKLTSLSTQSVINILSDWFNILGWPQSIRSDGGPQFGS